MTLLSIDIGIKHLAHCLLNEEGITAISTVLVLQLLGQKPDFFQKLFKDEDIRYKLDLIYFLNSLTVFLNDNFYKIRTKTPSISRDLFLSILEGTLDTQKFYNFDLYKERFLSNLE